MRPILGDKYRPVGYDGNRIGTAGAFIHATGPDYLIAKGASGVFHGLRIIHPNLYPGGKQGMNNFNARRFPHIIGISLKGQAPYRNLRVRYPGKRIDDARGIGFFLPGVGFFNTA